MKCSKVISKGRRCLLFLLVLLLAVGAVPVFAASSKEVVRKKQGKQYVFYVNGKKQKNKWITYKDKKYFAQKDGTAAVGSKKIKGEYYIFSAKGVLYEVSAKTTVKVKGTLYQVKKNGLAASGWDKKKQHYFDKTGKVCTGIKVIRGKFFRFSKSGKYNQTATKRLRKAAKLNADISKVYKVLGKPSKSTYGDGCNGILDPVTGAILSGKDGTLKYDGFYVFTFKATNGKEYYVGAADESEYYM